MLSRAAAIGGELRWRTWCGVVALPALLLAALIAIYSVDLPYYDQWIAIAPLLEKLADGTLRAGDVLALHNEHRLVIPRLIFLPLAVLTHWNTQAEMALAWLTLVGIAANWWRLLRATGWKARPATHGLFAVMALLVFHTLQFENVLSGFQFHFILPILFFGAALWMATALPVSRAFSGVMALATAATFSSAQGLLCWPLLVPVLWLRARHGAVRWWVSYAAVAMVNLALYFRGYATVSKHPATREAEQVLGYALAYLGAPFADGRLLPPAAQAQACGAVLLLIFIAAALGVWRRRDAVLTARALPWLTIGALALGTAVLTAWGRAGFGVQQAFETRYTTYAILLPIALLPLGALLLSSESVVRRGWRWLVICGATGLLTLHFTAQAARLEVWSEHRRQRLMSKAILQTRHLAQDIALGRFVSPEPARLGATVFALQQLGYLRLNPVESPRLTADARGDAQYGRILPTRPGSLVGGWAALPWRGEAADAVLLSYDDTQGQTAFFGMTLARLPCPPAVAATGIPALGESGWCVDLESTALPDDARTVQAWAYDAAANRAWRIAGETTIERE